jgi:hypothetical protein
MNRLAPGELIMGRHEGGDSLARRPGNSLRKVPSVGLTKPDSVVAFYDTQIEFTFRAAREIGPVVELWPGMVLITGPAEVDAILRSRDEEFIGTRTILDRPPA